MMMILVVMTNKSLLSIGSCKHVFCKSMLGNILLLPTIFAISS